MGKTVTNAYLIDLKVISNTKNEAKAAIGIDLYNEFVADDSSISLTKRRTSDSVISNIRFITKEF